MTTRWHSEWHMGRGDALSFVMPGLVPGIHVFLASKAWMAGTSPAMTMRIGCSSALARHRDAPPGGFRARQLGVRGLHAGEAGRHLIRERRGLPGVHVDVQRHVLRGGRDPTLAGVEQLLEKVHALGVVVEQLE